jgi:PadR family transcriptional regulator, regulatory protein PadR
MKNKIPGEMLKGSLKSIVLKLLAENDKMYGYEITRKVEELSEGKIQLSYGALYPVLHKLEKDGNLVTESQNVNNRTRIYYRLTPKGKSVAVEKIEELKEYIETLKVLLQPNPALQYAPVKAK